MRGLFFFPSVHLLWLPLPLLFGCLWCCAPYCAFYHIVHPALNQRFPNERLISICNNAVFIGCVSHTHTHIDVCMLCFVMVWWLIAYALHSRNLIWCVLFAGAFSAFTLDLILSLSLSLCVFSASILQVDFVPSLPTHCVGL